MKLVALEGIAVFPVHAGVNRQRGEADRAVWGIPRTRGGEPTAPVHLENMEDVFPVHAGVNRYHDAFCIYICKYSPYTRG